MEIFIRPLDTQFYRSGLPFDAGEDNEAVCFFPPYPRTLYGALRARGMLASGKSFATKRWDVNIYGDETKFGSFVIKGPFIAKMRRDGILSHHLPFPLDVAAEKESGQLVHLLPRFSTRNGLGWDMDIPRIMIMDQMQISEELGGNELKSLSDEYLFDFRTLGREYLTSNNLTRYREGNLSKSKIEDIFQSEDRVGIARDTSTRTAIEGRLYRAVHTRMNDKPDVVYDGYGLTAVLAGENGSYPEQGLLQLGGEFRAAFYCKVSNGEGNKWWEIHKSEVIDTIAETGRFKAYFITPAIFRNGSLPDVCTLRNDKVCLKLEISENSRFSFKLLSLCTGKPKWIGGWDIRKKSPKPMFPAVPEGSVYFFGFSDSEKGEWTKIDPHIRRQVAESIYEMYNFESWCCQDAWDSESSPNKEGFGIALIGGW